MKTSDQLKEIAGALSKAQGELKNVVKDSTNPHYKNDYASLDAITEAVRPVFARHGLSLVQIPTLRDGACVVESLILHSSGEWIAGESAAPVLKADPQGVGSATTYLRRYATAGIAGLAQTDDDGEAASTTKTAPAADPTPAPKGFTEWWTDMIAVADNGTLALQAAWKDSHAELRKYALAKHNRTWEELKAKAAKVPQAVTA